MKQYFSEAKQFFAFQWHITDECDQRCKHRYIFSGDVCKKPDSMIRAQMEDTFYNCLDFCEVNDRLYFYLTGGDPDASMTPQEYQTSPASLTTQP